MIAIPYLSAAKFSGPDAGQFLHAQLSADIAALDDGQATFACYCTPKGKVIGILLVSRVTDDYFVIGSAELLADTLDRLRKFVLRAELAMEMLDEQTVFGLEYPTDHLSAEGVIQAGVTSLHYLIAKGNERKPSAVEIDHWRHLELEQGVAWLDSWTTDRFLPQMLDAEAIGALSFSKGCYPGQEIVARTRYLGKLKRKPVRLELDGRPPVRTGDRVGLTQASGDSEGVVIDLATSEDGRELLFIVARYNAEQPVEIVSWDEREYVVV